MAPPHSVRRRWLPLLLPGFAVVVFALYAGTVRPGHLWWGTDDLTAYLMHGVNLMEGRPYADLHAVDDPGLPPSFERKAFPPVYSLVVALVDRAAAAGDGAAAVDHGPFAASPGTRGRYTAPLRPPDPDRPYGLDLLTLKRILAACLACGLLALAAAFRRAAGGAVLAASVVAVGLSPFLFAFRDEAFSEFLFVALAWSFLALVGRLDGSPERGPVARRRVLLAALTLALACGTRSAGLVLFPTLVVHDLMRHRRLRRTSLGVLALAGLAVLAWRAALPGVASGYLAKAVAQWRGDVVLENLSQFRWNLGRLWWNGFSEPLQAFVTGLTALLAALGFLARRRSEAFDVFAMLYMAMVLVLPTDSAWLRYLVPVLPVLLLYVFLGAEALGRELAGARGRRVALALTLALMGVTYAGAFAAQDDGPLPDGLDTPATHELVEWVDGHTAPDDVVVFGKPRFLTLATGRPALVYPRRFLYGQLPYADLWHHFQAVDARWFALKDEVPGPVGPYNAMTYSDRWFVEDFVERFPQQFTPVWSNGTYTVFRRRGSPYQLPDPRELSQR